MNLKPSFNERCHKLLITISPGSVTTYCEIASALGSKACRAVGTAMAKNTDLINPPPPQSDRKRRKNQGIRLFVQLKKWNDSNWKQWKFTMEELKTLI